MRIILQRAVGKLGTPGDIVEVADGYARNYLLPRGLAIPASRGAVRHAGRLRAGHVERTRRDRVEAESFAQELARTPVRVTSQAGEDGRLFGSVTAHQIADELSKALGREIDRKRIHLEEPIRSIGTHDVRVHLHPEVNATVTVEVTGR